MAAMAAFAFGAEPDAKQVREHFKSDNYTVEWEPHAPSSPARSWRLATGPATDSRLTGYVSGLETDVWMSSPSSVLRGGRCVYYAINAVTRLTKQDVRDKLVEEMDVEKTRQRVLEMLRGRK